jgi:hypothetical protein
VSGTENSIQELFGRAASWLLGNEVETAGDHDAMNILRALEYSAEFGGRNHPDTANRARLLIAASRFNRVFELTSPDAPGLFSFGAQFDPAIADPMHAGSPIVGVSGVGLAVACVLFATTLNAGGYWAVGVILLAALFHLVGEVLYIAAAWTITATLTEGRWTPSSHPK